MLFELPYGLTVDVALDNGVIISGLPREVDDDGREFNAAMDGIEAFVLALACEGVDLTQPVFAKAIETAVDACGNNL